LFLTASNLVETSRNVTAHAQKPDFVFFDETKESV